MGEHTSHVINWWTFDAQRPPMGWFLLDFLIFVAGLVYVARQPLQEAFAERHQSIKRAIADAAQEHAKASQAQADARRRLASLATEVKRMADDSDKDGEAERQQMVADAEAYREQMQSELEILKEQESRRSQLRLQNELMTHAINQAEAVVQQRLTEKDRLRLVERSIEELGADGGPLDAWSKQASS